METIRHSYPWSYRLLGLGGVVFVGVVSVLGWDDFAGPQIGVLVALIVLMGGGGVWLAFGWPAFVTGPDGIGREGEAPIPWSEVQSFSIEMSGLVIRGGGRTLKAASLLHDAGTLAERALRAAIANAHGPPLERVAATRAPWVVMLVLGGLVLGGAIVASASGDHGAWPALSFFGVALPLLAAALSPRQLRFEPDALVVEAPLRTRRIPWASATLGLFSHQGALQLALWDANGLPTPIATRGAPTSEVLRGILAASGKPIDELRVPRALPPDARWALAGIVLRWLVLPVGALGVAIVALAPDTSHLSALERADLALAHGEARRAYHEANGWLALHPNDALAHRIRVDARLAIAPTEHDHLPDRDALFAEHEARVGADDPHVRAIAHRALGALELDADRPTEALSHFDAAIASEDDPRLRVDRARAALALGEPHEAIVSVEGVESCGAWAVRTSAWAELDERDTLARALTERPTRACLSPIRRLGLALRTHSPIALLSALGAVSAERGPMVLAGVLFVLASARQIRRRPGPLLGGALVGLVGVLGGFAVAWIDLGIRPGVIGLAVVVLLGWLVVAMPLVRPEDRGTHAWLVGLGVSIAPLAVMTGAPVSAVVPLLVSGAVAAPTAGRLFAERSGRPRWLGSLLAAASVLGVIVASALAPADLAAVPAMFLLATALGASRLLRLKRETDAARVEELWLAALGWLAASTLHDVALRPAFASVTALGLGTLVLLPWVGLLAQREELASRAARRDALDPER